ncbi:ATP-binding protein [Cereibacter sphaeroides]|uniref:ATP-binding protein n=1 Tax=Cereibacter sphaeroides TaxID=1063 RepID=UPI000F5467AA|nr:ATP-binding protein [Cereibacter sphaeroides]AZB65111.1 ATP-binding protein [Cereibacter sphaeroides]AZB66946.1 ATP-binding protein [Cereibacter sphaeroides]
MPSDAGPVSASYRLRLDSRPLAVRAALAELADCPPLRALPAEARDAAQILLAEVLNNCTEHAYAGRSGPVEVALDLRRGQLSCEVADRGRPMPGAGPEARPGLPCPVLSLREGGFGWMLIRALAEELRYCHEDGVNRLSFRVARTCLAAPEPCRCPRTAISPESGCESAPGDCEGRACSG